MSKRGINTFSSNKNTLQKKKRSNFSQQFGITMKRKDTCVMLVSLVVVLTISGFEVGKSQAQVHHVVGEDRGWDSSSDIQSWSSNRIFRVGDNIWFAYSAGQEMVAELRSEEEFESCNITNPIKMYTEGLNKVVLEQEGRRYFVSGRSERCKNGLRLCVDVLPRGQEEKENIPGVALAEEPSSSSSNRLGGGFKLPLSLYFLLQFCLIWICHSV